MPALICAVNLYVGVIDPSNGAEKAATLLLIVMAVGACQVLVQLVSFWHANTTVSAVEGEEPAKP